MPFRFAAAALLAAFALPAAATSADRSPPAGSEIQLFVENDKWASTDRYYTNGIKLGVGVPFDLLQTPAAAVLRGLGPGQRRRHPGRAVPRPEHVHAA